MVAREKFVLFLQAFHPGLREGGREGERKGEREGGREYEQERSSGGHRMQGIKGTKKHGPKQEGGRKGGRAGGREGGREGKRRNLDAALLSDFDRIHDDLWLLIVGFLHHVTRGKVGPK
jgi:hypothetical protein